MKIEEKISILSEALSKHLRFIRKMGGMYSLSAIEHADENGYVCEIAWNGLHQQTIRVSKKTKEEAYDDVARILSEIIAAVEFAGRFPKSEQDRRLLSHDL